MKVYFVLSFGLLVVSGCSSVSPFASSTQGPVPISSQIANNANGISGRSASNPLALGRQLTQTGANSYTQGPAKPDNPFLAGLRSASASIEKALTIEPRVISAVDATSLAGPPTNVGADLHYEAAKVYESQNNISGAISHYQKALEISPRDPLILVSLGRLYDGQGDLQRAEGLYLQAQQAAPTNCAVLNALGVCCAKQGDLDNALAYLYKASRLQPQNARYKNNMANVLCDAGRVDEAYAQLLFVHGEAGAHYNLGFMLFHHGRRDEAQRELKLALRANPYMEQAQRLLNAIQPSSSPDRPASLQTEVPRQYTVSPAYDSEGTKPGERWPQLEGPSLNRSSRDAPYNLPPL